MEVDLQAFFDRQLSHWPEVRERYEALRNVLTRSLEVDGFRFTLQYNPARAVSTGAAVDAASLAKRHCFLCEANRPGCQMALPLLEGRYELLVNPFPIFEPHFTIPAREHTPQSLEGRIVDLRALARQLPGYAVFFNGARSGASAPDHQHFQAVPAHCLPALADGAKLPYAVSDEAPEGSAEMANVVAWGDRLLAIPRRAHRPRIYGPEGLMVSPGAVDLLGVIILPRKADYETLTTEGLREILNDVCYETTSC